MKHLKSVRTLVKKREEEKRKIYTGEPKLVQQNEQF